MKPCAKCKRQIPEDDYPIFHGKRTGTCEPCLRRMREIYSENREIKARSLMAGTIPWEAVKKAYSLTPAESKAVDKAAGQIIASREWKRRHPGQKWAGKTAEAVVDAVGKTVARRCQLLGAVSHRLKERLVADGIDPAEWLNWRRGLR